MESCYITAQWISLVLCSDLERWDEKMEGERLKKVGIYIYNYGWSSLMYSRNQHNIVKQLSFSWKIILQSDPISLFSWPPLCIVTAFLLPPASSLTTPLMLKATSGPPVMAAFQFFTQALLIPNLEYSFCLEASFHSSRVWLSSFDPK